MSVFCDQYEVFDSYTDPALWIIDSRFDGMCDTRAFSILIGTITFQQQFMLMMGGTIWIQV